MAKIIEFPVERTKGNWAKRLRIVVGPRIPYLDEYASTIDAGTKPHTICNDETDDGTLLTDYTSEEIESMIRAALRLPYLVDPDDTKENE